MTAFARALETSTLLAEKVASARPASPSLREKLALADFADLLCANGFHDIEHVPDRHA